MLVHCAPSYKCAAKMFTCHISAIYVFLKSDALPNPVIEDRMVAFIIAVEYINSNLFIC